MSDVSIEQVLRNIGDFSGDLQPSDEEVHKSAVGGTVHSHAQPGRFTVSNFDWKHLLSTVAPTIGTALGGPAGGVAFKYLADNFLGKPDATESDMEEAVKNASPDALAKLKEVDNQFKKDMAQVGLDLSKLEVQDRQGARDLFKVNIWPQIVLSAAFIIGYFVILTLLMSRPSDWSDTMNKNEWLQGMLMTILGVLTAAVPQILNFWFGSSLGSKEKNATVHASLMQGRK